MTTAYDFMHSTGIDMGPYTKLYGALAALAQGRPVPPDPVPATFADGVAGQAVLDAVRQSAATATWVPVEAA